MFPDANDANTHAQLVIDRLIPLLGKYFNRNIVSIAFTSLNVLAFICTDFY